MNDTEQQETQVQIPKQSTDIQVIDPDQFINNEENKIEVAEQICKEDNNENQQEQNNEEEQYSQILQYLNANNSQPTSKSKSILHIEEEIKSEINNSPSERNILCEERVNQIDKSASLRNFYQVKQITSQETNSLDTTQQNEERFEDADENISYPSQSHKSSRKRSNLQQKLSQEDVCKQLFPKEEEKIEQNVNQDEEFDIKKKIQEPQPPKVDLELKRKQELQQQFQVIRDQYENLHLLDQKIINVRRETKLKQDIYQERQLKIQSIKTQRESINQNLVQIKNEWISIIKQFDETIITIKKDIIQRIAKKQKELKTKKETLKFKNDELNLQIQKQNELQDMVRSIQQELKQNKLDLQSIKDSVIEMSQFQQQECSRFSVILMQNLLELNDQLIWNNGQIISLKDSLLRLKGQDESEQKVNQQEFLFIEDLKKELSINEDMLNQIQTENQELNQTVQQNEKKSRDLEIAEKRNDNVKVLLQIQNEEIKYEEEKYNQEYIHFTQELSEQETQINTLKQELMQQKQYMQQYKQTKLSQLKEYQYQVNENLQEVREKLMNAENELNFKLAQLKQIDKEIAKY